ncbi:LOW QUALITY PROTEIN: cactin [Aphis gossypii]|uniref:LOW QUALITY PROTEIN: cactin n=1 Tax=Aphis gossypii TaxID=80765 RepID=UPI0021590F15|nr:LOW QUALITY PROTEIN: cactin [Aphis gossypii]
MSPTSRHFSKSKDSKKNIDEQKSHKHDRHSSKKKKSKSKHKSKRRSSSSDSSSNDEAKLLQRLQQERLRVAEERRQQKELIKGMETPEEKRFRRLMKKTAKERKRKELMGWDNDYLHYTNADNPFGDANLLSTFVWDKKMAKDGLVGVSHEELELRNRQKMEENKRELEKVKKRRMEREMERQQREDEMALLQRSKEAAQFKEWEKSEDQFHLQQARLRSTIRIEDGRAKPIDLLAKYISTEEEVDAVEMHEPYIYLNGLKLKDLEDLVEDIKVYMELEKGKNFDYWNDITVIVEDELHKMRRIQKQSAYTGVGRREGIHQSVAHEVAHIFRGKTAEQLDQLKIQIEKKINSKAEGVDIGYWETLLSQLKAHVARARLRDRHQENLKKKLEVLKAQQKMDESQFDPEEGCSSHNSRQQLTKVNESSGQDQPSTSTRKSPSRKEKIQSSEEDISDAEQEARNIIEECAADYEACGYSPVYISPNSVELGTLVVSEIDDEKRLTFARLQVQGTGTRIENVMAAEEMALQKEARKGMTNEEAEFSVESELDHQVYLWSDKYRPRKPRYFNRVHTGFEWNKYNQTHYDMDNPPPKIVQGYKFNIFYPDLINKSSTPQYFLTACGDNPEFAVLRFHAGPPYEDIAFKIVNREWEYSYKRGFRCQFHNNIFQLWFHFKRYRYRR